MAWGALMAVGDRLAVDDRYTAEHGLVAYLDFNSAGRNARRMSAAWKHGALDFGVGGSKIGK